MTDIELGTKVLKSFWNWSRMLNAGSFKVSFDEFLKSYGSKINIYLDGIGGAIKAAEVSDSRIDSAMRSLAIASKGKIPSDYQVYFKYISNEAVKVNWIDAVAYTAIESVKDIASGAQAVGNSILTTGKILNFLLPGIALIFVIFWINKHTDGGLAKVAGHFRK